MIAPTSSLPRAEFVIEAFCYNPCDKANKKLMRIIFPNAKMDNAIDMTFTNELAHPGQD